MKQKGNTYKFKLCPECYSCNFNYEEHTGEVSCARCGLIIQAPPTTDYKPAGFKLHIIEANFNNIIVIVETLKEKQTTPIRNNK